MDEYIYILTPERTSDLKGKYLAIAVEKVTEKRYYLSKSPLSLNCLTFIQRSAIKGKGLISGFIHAKLVKFEKEPSSEEIDNLLREHKKTCLEWKVNSLQNKIKRTTEELQDVRHLLTQISPLHTDNSGLDVGDVSDAIWTIKAAIDGHPEYQFNESNYKTEHVVDYNTLIPRCQEVAGDLFRKVTVEEGIGQHFNILDIEVNGDAFVSVDLPDNGEIKLAPFYYYREYNLADIGDGIFNRAFVNNETLSYEAVLLEFIVSSFHHSFAETVMGGNGEEYDPIDGLLTQVLKDNKIPSSQHAGIRPNPSNAVAEFEKVLSVIPPHMFSNVMDEPILWFTPNQHLQDYVVNYKTVYSTLPYRNRYEAFGMDSALKRTKFIHTAHLTDTHILSPKSNLYLGLSKDLDVDIQHQDQYLFVRVEGHVGVGYTSSDQICLGTS